jgi:hypothetical protein
MAESRPSHTDCVIGICSFQAAAVPAVSATQQLPAAFWGASWTYARSSGLGGQALRAGPGPVIRKTTSCVEVIGGSPNRSL